MSRGKSSRPTDASDEISALIETLHQTGQRLEELTAGEVDAVSDRDGRTFLLRHAQEALRHSEAAKHAAVLNALPAHIALLDTRGMIISVNEAWRRFASASALPNPGYGIGLNYLEVCDRTRGDDSSEARQVAAGIRSVLAGTIASFSSEYACDSPTAKRWFRMMVTPLGAGRPNGAVTMHLDISERKRAEQQIQLKNTILQTQQETSPDAILVVDESRKIVSYNQRFVDLWRISPVLVSARVDAPVLQAVADQAQNPEAFGARVQFVYAHRDLKSHEEVPLKDGRIIDRYSAPVIGAEGGYYGRVWYFRDISERKKAEQKFKDLLESAPDAMVIVNRDAEMVLVNAQAVKLFGWQREELLGQKIDTLVPERFRGVHPGNRKGFFEEARPRPMGAGKDLFLLHKDGTEFPVEISLSPLETGEGTLVICAVRDITERKQAEDALRQSKNLLQLVVDNVPSRIFWKDRDLRYLGCNTLFAKDAGHFVPEELTGKTDFDMGWKDQAELYRGDDRTVLESGRAKLDIEEPQTRPDGNTIWLSTSKVPLRDKDNQIIGILGLYQDITERRQAAQDLRESERRFSDLLGNVELISMMLDREARITYCNEYLLRLTGWRLEDVIGGNWFDFFMPPEIGDLKETFFATLIANLPGARHHENEILTRSGERRLIRWNNSVLRSGAGDVIGTASIGEDITEQKRSEIRIKRLNRVYAVLSGINTLIVRTRDRQELFDEACRITVEQGEFRLAWIGLLDANGLDVTPMARAGADEGYLDNIQFTTRDDAHDRCEMLTRALREKAVVICNDIETDPQMARWREEALRRGYRSVVVLPLQFADKVLGVLLLYAAEKDFFDIEEMKLLAELAGDIAFAIDHLEKQARLDYLAYYDELTGLANRTLFLERLAQSMRSAASGGHKLALYLIDLERFKNINDSLGRPAGDALLRQVAGWLTRSVGDAGLLARVGADVFAAVLPEVRQDGDLARFLENRMDAFVEHPFRLNDAVFRIAVKIGGALFPEDGADAETLFRHAEAALKKAKASGQRYLFYTQTMTDAVAGKLSLENQLRQAIDNEEFVLHYQPKVNLVSGAMSGAEALIRWNDPRTGLVPPGRFIPILEETGMIYEVGRWALRQAVADYLRWRTAGLPAVRIAVNVSPLQLRHRDFIDELRQAISIDAQAAAGLELEITESVIMEDVKHTIAILQAVRIMGVSVAIDDFGTGFSSLSYLARLPVDRLKIDRSFVIDMTAGPEGLALVSTVINLAHSLKLKVVAEGVETEEQSRLLRLLNCDEMQGFLFSKPVPTEAFETRFLAPRGEK